MLTEKQLSTDQAMRHHRTTDKNTTTPVFFPLVLLPVDRISRCNLSEY